MNAEVLWSGLWPNKQMVPTLPARGSFKICARHKRLGGGFGFVLPLRARAGRTCEALGRFLVEKGNYGCKSRNSVDTSSNDT